MKIISVLILVMMILPLLGSANAQYDSIGEEIKTESTPAPYYTFRCSYLPYKHSFLKPAGFTGLYNFSGIQGFLLSPGEKATVTYSIEKTFDIPARFENYTENQILTNNAFFYEKEEIILQNNIETRTKIGDNGQPTIEYRYSYTTPYGTTYSTSSTTKPEDTIIIPTNKPVNPGATINFEPSKLTLGNIVDTLNHNHTNDLAITATIQLDENATKGTYWLSFNENPCLGTPLVLFTIGDSLYQGDENEIMQCPYGYQNKLRACLEFKSPASLYDHEFSIHEKRDILSPLKQFKFGILPSEIKCKTDFKLIQKYDSSPACVKPETKQKLIERGWAKAN